MLVSGVRSHGMYGCEGCRRRGCTCVWRRLGDRREAENELDWLLSMGLMWATDLKTGLKGFEKRVGMKGISRKAAPARGEQGGTHGGTQQGRHGTLRPQKRPRWSSDSTRLCNLPVRIVEDHNDALEHVHWAIRRGHLPFRGAGMVRRHARDNAPGVCVVLCV
jgi:hypothetical protein